MEKSLRHAVIEWDIITWGRAVDFWNTDKLSSAEKRGGGFGGVQRPPGVCWRRGACPLQKDTVLFLT